MGKRNTIIVDLDFELNRIISFVMQCNALDQTDPRSSTELLWLLENLLYILCKEVKTVCLYGSISSFK